MVFSHTTRGNQFLASIGADSGHSKVKQSFINSSLPLHAAYHVLDVPNPFSRSTHLTGSWPAVDDARPTATGGWHGTRQQFTHNEALRDENDVTHVDDGV